jgi:membrane fusion protein, multidrug efflux system
MSTQSKTYAILLILLSFSVSACGRGAAQPNQAVNVGENGSGRGGRGGGRGDGGGARGEGGPVPVTTTHVQEKAVPVTIPAVGTAEAISTVQIRAQVTGQLSQVHFAEGQEVKKGDPLFSLDSRPFDAALQQAVAVLARDTATANNAAAQNSRYEDLYKRGLIPRDQYETQQASSQSAQATLDADRAAVETAKLNVAYTRITAPISGRTGALSAHVGDLVRANDTTPLVIINQLAPIYVTFAVPGRYLSDIRRYQSQHPLQVIARGQASVPPGAQPQAPSSYPETTPAPTEPGMAEAVPTATGGVTFIDNTVDPTTGTIKLKGTFPNSDHKLWPGLFVQVTLHLATDPNAIVVPAIAVQASQSGQFVYVVKPDSTVEMRSVTVERQQGEQMVIARGLSAGEEVVTDGQLRLTPGARIVRAEAGARGRGSRAATGTGATGNGEL